VLSCGVRYNGHSHFHSTFFITINYLFAEMSLKEMDEDSNSAFVSLEVLPPDLGLEKLPEEYNADQCPDKVSLGAGVYRTNEGESWILPAVNEAFLAGDCSDRRPRKGSWRIPVIITSTSPSQVTYHSC
jgi:hypothetical protein